MIKKGLSVLVAESGMDYSRLSAGVEDWFNSVMERASGWYKRRMATAIMVIASVLTVASNADSILMLNVLWTSSATRTSVAGLSQEFLAAQSNRAGESESDDAAGAASAEYLRQSYGVLNQSLLGWAGEDVPGLSVYIQRRPPAYECPAGDTACVQNFLLAWATKLIGLVLTIAAISLGAPFWFDLLNRVARLRASGGKPAGRLLKLFDAA